MEMVNGYVFLDLTKANVYSKALKVLGTDKPVVIKDGSGSPYFVDSLTLDGTSIIITKGGKTITIANDNTITNVGDISTIMENIVDSKGNKRFVEGEGELETISGVTVTYNKWSLSGTHLMCVLAGTIADTTVISGYPTLSTINLPEYILDKIIPVYNDVVSLSNVTCYASDNSTQVMTVSCQKITDSIKFVLGSLTLTKERTFRIQIDLLIDQE